MRDPERIERIMELLHEIWQLDKDMRFMQLIYNIQRSYSHRNKDAGLIKSVEKDGFSRSGFDLFALEDDQVEPFLVDYLAEWKSRRV